MVLTLIFLSKIYILLTDTRYALAAATSIMLWMVIKKPPTDVARKVRQNKDWS
jgi:hypothetical protein